MRETRLGPVPDMGACGGGAGGAGRSCGGSTAMLSSWLGGSAGEGDRRTFGREGEGVRGRVRCREVERRRGVVDRCRRPRRRSSSSPMSCRRRLSSLSTSSSSSETRLRKPRIALSMARVVRRSRRSSALSRARMYSRSEPWRVMWAR